MKRNAKNKDEAFSDLYRWAVLSDSGLVVTRDARFLVGYKVNPPDASSSTLDTRFQLAGTVNAALARLGSGWSLWSEVAVTPSASYPPPEVNHFPDPVSRAVDEERRQQFLAEGEHFENERFLVLCYTPPKPIVSRLADAMYRDGAEDKRSPFKLALAAMEKVVGQFEDQVADALGLERLLSVLSDYDEMGRQHHTDELVDFLAYTAYGKRVSLKIPDDGAFLDTVISGQDFTPGHTPLLGEEFIACVAIDGFPAQTMPGLLDRLSVLDIPYRFSQRFIVRDPQDAEKDIKQFRWKWALQEYPLFLKALGMTNLPHNADAARMREECDLALSLAREGRVKFGYYNATVVLRHTDRAYLRDMARAVVRVINEAGFSARIEEENATAAFMSSLPGNVEANVRRPMLHTANLADLMPNNGVWTGEAFNPNPLYFPKPSPALMHARTEGGIPFRFNTSVSDLNNFAMFAPPGAGKTTLMNTIAMQALRYPCMRIRAIDFKKGMMATCLGVGGRYHVLGASDRPTLAPFAHLETEADMGRAQQWAEACFQLQSNTKLEARHRNAIRQGLEALREERELRSVTNFMVVVQDEEVREALQFYCLEKGAGGPLFDADSEDDRTTHFDAYDITNIIQSGDQILLPALMCLSNRFEREENGDPMYRLIDEAWAAVSHPVWKPKLRSDLKTKRSKNVGIGLATQNLSDVAREGFFDVFEENVPTRIYGPNDRAQAVGTKDIPGPADFYAMSGLEWHHREILRTATPKRHYFIKQGNRCRLVDFGFGKLTLSLAGATSERAVHEIENLRATYGDDWLPHHLAANGVDYASILR